MSSDNQISPTESENKAHDDSTGTMPSANSTERDSGNNKKLKTAVILIFGVLILLVGIGIAVGKYAEKRKDDKAQEAERIATEQKRMSEGGNKVNIAGDQEKIVAMSALPAPASASEPISTTAMNVAQPSSNSTQPNVVTPAPYTPKYNQYKPPQQYEPATTPVQPNSPYQASNNAPVTQNQNIDDDVLIDVVGQRATHATRSEEGKETGLANQLQSSKLAYGIASKKGDVTMLLSKGTTIPCVLVTKLDSTYKGFTTCQVAKDVYSANGRVLLVERGSTVFGEQNIDIKQGQARLAVLWSRIETPKGVSVDIDSPASGQLGQMGIDAQVNNHFWKRFGGAIMLSMIKDVSANASTRLSSGGDNNNQNSTQNTSNATESMAEKALDNTINIPPTATVNHGKLIQIFVVRDIDFKGIYELRQQ